MIPIEELRRENEEITDLCHVLVPLIKDPGLRNNAVFCELLERFNNKVHLHLNHESRSVYGELLSGADGTVSKVASQFIDNTHELNRLFDKYNRTWCKKDRQGGEEEAFVKDTEELFGLVCDRVQLENERLFPLLE